MSGIGCEGSKEALARIRHQLELQLKKGREIPVEDLAAGIRDEGFRCLRCAECCRGEDNSVAAFPSEVRKIMERTGESWLEVAEPPSMGEWDLEGNFHTLEWRLKKGGSDCKYHRDDGCQIYEDRPILCQTYPFYLDDGRLACSECRGLGNPIGVEDSLNLASLVKTRYLIEIQEAIDLIRRYEDFERGMPSKGGVCVVHDSEGEHRIDWSCLPGFLDLCLGCVRG